MPLLEDLDIEGEFSAVERSQTTHLIKALGETSETEFALACALYRLSCHLDEKEKDIAHSIAEISAAEAGRSAALRVVQENLKGACSPYEVLDLLDKFEMDIVLAPYLIRDRHKMLTQICETNHLLDDVITNHTMITCWQSEKANKKLTDKMKDIYEWVARYAITDIVFLSLTEEDD